MEERLTELETKAMFQDQTIEELHQAIYDQQQQIDSLAEEITFLKKQLLNLHRTVNGEEEDFTPAP